jgi:hypothetical protein
MEGDSPEFELGDGIFIGGGRLDGTRGRIYYMDDDLIRILPAGASDRLIDIPLVEGDLEPSLGIENFYQTSKRAVPAFVSQIDAHVGDIAETFGENGAPGISYTVQEVNEKEDTIKLLDDTGAESEIEFNFKGIPLDAGFVVLRPRQNAAKVTETEEAPPEPEEDIFGEIDVEEEVGLVERPNTQRIYPDIVQRNDMFQNLLDMLDVGAQKNVKSQRDTRRMVEQLLLLRNEVVKYSRTGEPEGKLLTSFQTIIELLDKTDIPLSRPVLEASRSVYFKKSEDDNPTEIPGMDVDIHYLRDVIDDSNEYIKTQLGGTTGQLTTPDALPHWFVGWETFFKRYMRSWISDNSAGESISFQADKEFLRAPLYDGMEPTVDGLPKSEEPSVTASNLGKVRLSLMKGLGPRSTRLKEKEPQRRIETGDEGIMVNQILFPLKAKRDLGSTRSGKLVNDIAYSQSRQKTILETIEGLGGIPETPMGGGIISIGEGGNTSGNISIEDWLKVQPILIHGLGDALIELKNLGMAQKELSVEQQDVLVDKIKMFIALLKNHVATERINSAKKLTDLRLEDFPFLQGEALEEFMVALESEPLIQKRIQELKGQIPAYKNIDIAIVAGVCTEMYDLLLSVLAGIPASLAKERNRRVRDQFLEALRQALLKGEKRMNEGEIPQPIQCPHVESLDAIRKVKNPDERMQLLARLLARFRGPIKDNWVQCSASAQGNPHHLMCYHEFLHLQEYLHPREKDALHKELLLNFSGGSFQGKYMCKNCGQPISDIEFDQSMEFDDNGRPMANNAALVDTVAVAQGQVDALLGENNDEVTFANDTQTSIYKTARQIFDRLGIYAQLDTFKNIVERVESDIQKQPSREQYALAMKARKGEKKSVEYDVMISRVQVSSVGAHSLIEIQSHIPDFILRYKIPGCVAGFSGFPIGKEADKTGINYMSCAIAGIKVNQYPWNLTGFIGMSNEKRRLELIADGIETMVQKSLKTAIVQRLLSVKQAHYEKIYGRNTVTDTIPEFVPAGFRPVPYFITKEDATKNIVVPEAAGPLEVVRAWVQMAHRLARENGSFVAGSPFSETACCYTPISEPRDFWNGKETVLPKLPIKSAPRGQACSQIMLPFKPRKASRLLADPPEDLFYRVFLRICYDGPRKGLPHEPGYTNICAHCGFVFPENPYIVSAGPPLTKDLFKEWQTETDAIITKGKSALESQKVVVDRGTFEMILDTAHRRFRVEIPKQKVPATGTALLAKLLEPEPFEGCYLLISETITKVSGMTPNPSEMDIATSYSPLSDNSREIMGEIEAHLGAGVLNTLRRLLKQSPTQIVESIRSYFLIPFQRLILQFNPDSLTVQKSYKLPQDTQEDVNKSLESHFQYLHSLKRNVKGYAEIKLKQAQKQLAHVLKIIQNEIRPSLIPGGEIGTHYLVEALIFGILGEFINPNVIPQGVSGTGGAIEATARVPLHILEVCVSRLKLEGLNLTEDEIRDLIARRTAAEKDLFTTGQNKMTDDEKKADKMMKRLGLGKWAVGGTKAVYVLDPAQYDREREQRIEMGLGDFAMNPDDAAYAAGLLNEDNYGGGGQGAEGGYDVEQMAADDY